MVKCLLCRGQVSPALDLGSQPVTCHFLGAGAPPAAEFPLALGICDSCATVQLCQPFPSRALTPRHGWVTYREPEDHLDALVATITALDGISPAAVIGGISFKDRTTVERFATRGYRNTWCLDVWGDLGASDPNANIESVHDLLTPDKVRELVSRRGQADVIIARHIIEHAADPRRLLTALSSLLRDGGYLVLEAPDSGKNMARQDYTMIWEEHALYFTDDSFRRLLAGSGLAMVRAQSYPYFFEDCLVQIARKVPSAAVIDGVPEPAAKRAADELFASLAGSFPAWTARYRDAISRLAQGAPAALYGAGHLTAAFVNFHQLTDLFAFVVDDTPQKQGLKLPNSGLDIVPRERLIADGVKLCLFGLSPHAEEKIVQKNQEFLQRGGVFHSIFADSQRSLRQAMVQPAGRQASG